MSEISEKARVRLLGGGTPEKSPPPEPQPAAEPRTPAPEDRRTPVASAPIFLADSADGVDMLDVAIAIQPLAELCAVAQVQTPFMAAIVGAAGSGKTFALRRFAQLIEGLAGSPGALSRIVAARIDASDGADAPIAIASAAYGALDREPGGVDYSAVIDECAHAGGDPLRAANAASDRHDEIVRRLEAERVQRDEAEARRARLADALLFETPGSRVDAFARARRGAIESRLRRFDLVSGSDAGSSYREFVRDMASMGPVSQVGVALRAIWAYPGQRRLLFWAIVAFILGFGVNLLHGAQALDAIRSLPGPSETIATWISGHAGWFDRAASVLYALGLLALLLNVWRAISFSSLLFRGTRILNTELRDRRRDLEARVTRLNQRVAALTTEAEAAAKRAEAAASRAGGKTSTRGPAPDFLAANLNPGAGARGFLAALSRRIEQDPSDGTPERIVFVIDNLDALPPDRAIAWIDSAQNALGKGLVGVIAFDPSRLVPALGGPEEARRRMDKWLQALVNLPGRAKLDGERLIARLLASEGRAESSPTGAVLSPALTEPLSSAETSLLTALAPLAAHSPRGAKRFLNAYRLSRSAKAPRPVIALMQAVAFADDDVRAAVANRLMTGSTELGEFEGPELLVSAVKAARAANGGAIVLSDARAAAEVAQRYAHSL